MELSEAEPVKRKWFLPVEALPLLLPISLVVTGFVDPTTGLIFLIVGAIVSLDVTGLTLSHAEKFSNEPELLRGWARSNAFWHSILLAIYVLAISGIFSFSLGFLEKFRSAALLFLAAIEVSPELIARAEVVFGMLTEHSSLFLGVITLFIVWGTYSDKIISRPELGNRRELPILAKAVYDIVELFARGWLRLTTDPADLGSMAEHGRIQKLAVKLNFQAQAALVAVDMLALAALMKFLGYLRGWENQVALIAMVFSVVFFFAYCSGRAGARAFARIVDEVSSEANKNAAAPAENSISGEPERATKKRFDWSAAAFAHSWLVVTLRLVEPLLIFYFVLELIGFLIFEEPIHTVGFSFGALLLLLGLVRRHGLRKIIRRALGMPDAGSEGNLPANDDKLRGKGREFDGTTLRPLPQVWSELVEPLKKFGLAFVVGLLGVVSAVLFIWCFDGVLPGTGSLDSLDSWVSVLLSIVSFVTAFAFWSAGVPVVGRVFPMLERRIHAALDWIHESRVMFVFVFGALALAAILPIYDTMAKTVFQGGFARELSGAEQLALMGIRENHLHALQVAILFVFIAALGKVFDLAFIKAGGKRGDESLSKRAIANGHYGNVLFACGLLLAGMAFAQQGLREQLLPILQGAAESNGGILQNRHVLNLPLERPLSGRRVSLWLIDGPYNSTMGSRNVAEILTFAGAELRVISVSVSGKLEAERVAELKAELESTDVLVIPEQFGAREIVRREKGTPHYLDDLEAYVNSCSAVINEWAKKPGRRIVVMEGDKYSDPGVAVMQRLGFFTVKSIDSGIGTVSLKVEDEDHKLLQGVKDLGAANGYLVFTSSNADVNAVITSGSSTRMVVAELGPLTMLGFDFHTYQESHRTLLINACRDPLK